MENKQESEKLEHRENAAAPLNARFVTSVLTRTADIIEGAVEAGGAWDVEEAIRQASREFRESHLLLEGPEPNYGTVLCRSRWREKIPYRRKRRESPRQCRNSRTPAGAARQGNTPAPTTRDRERGKN